MDERFRARLKSSIAEYRAWSAGRALSTCRLVQYCGVDLVGAKSPALADVEREIEALICEGLNVDWEAHRSCLYLRVWESGGPEPEWSNVFAEVPLADVSDLLRQAGLDA
jgi:hypothetical protein